MSEGLRDKFLSQASDAGVAKRTHAELQMKVRETAKDVAILSMTAGEGSTLENNQQNVIINLADRKFFFDMELRTEQGKDLPSDAKLEIGKFYFVRVSVSLNRFVDSPHIDQNMLKQQEVIIDQKLGITLESSTLTMHGEIGQVELRCRRDWYIDFLIQVGDRCQEELSSLELKYQESGSHNRLRFASSLAVKVNTNKKVISPTPVSLTANLSNANNAAILYVIPNGETEWLIQGVSPHESLNCSISAPSLPLDLCDFARDCIDDILNWLRGVKSYFNDRFNLAIVDRTSQQISWEAIQLDSNEFLAEKAKIVRWVEQKSWGKTILLDLELPKTYQGRLVPYEHPSGTSCNDLHDRLNLWRENIRQHDRQPVAIALLHCEQELNNHLNQVRFDDLERCLPDRPLFLFVNSPRSARLLWKDKRPSGIAAKALSQVASGYLGTMGEVEAKLAKAFRKKFIEYASSDNGVSPALFLQGLRANYKHWFTGNDLQKRQAEQIFSYVYYGNPDDVVKITGGGQS